MQNVKCSSFNKLQLLKSNNDKLVNWDNETFAHPPIRSIDLNIFKVKVRTLEKFIQWLCANFNANKQTNKLNPKKSK